MKTARIGRVCGALLAITLVAPTALLAELPFAASIDYLYGKSELFPSALVSVMSPPGAPGQLGDPSGVIAVRIKAPAANSVVSVELGATSLFAASSARNVRLQDQGRDYWIAPFVRYDLEKLARLKQPIANLAIQLTVTVDGQKRVLTDKLVVHSINDWIYRYALRTDRVKKSAKSWAAAYVNENNPWIDRFITREVFKNNPQPTFTLTGYARPGRRAEEQEIRAIYEALRSLGFHYSALSQSSVATKGVGDRQFENESGILAAHVRLMSEALASRQANGIETAMILASVCRKLQLDAVIILAPLPSARSSSLLGVYLAPGRNKEDLVVLDPNAIGDDSYEVAKAKGRKIYDEVRNYLPPFVPDPDDRKLYEQLNYLWIDIGESRANGVAPIPDAEPEDTPDAAAGSAIKIVPKKI